MPSIKSFTLELSPNLNFMAPDLEVSIAKEAKKKESMGISN